MSSHRRQRARLLTVLALIIVGGWTLWRAMGTRAERAARLLSEARAAHAAGDLSRAVQSADAAWRLDPTLGEAALLAARCAASLGHFDQAVKFSDGVVADDQSSYLQAALLRARLEQQRLYRFARAEQAYLVALEIEPDNLQANQGLAQLLGICARREEAVPHVLRLVRQGVPTDLLIMIARESGVANDPEALARAREADPRDPNPLIGMAWHAADAGQVDAAIDLLREAVQLQPMHAAAQVALGRQLLAANRYHELVQWAEQIPPAAHEFSEFWMIRAQYAEQRHDVRGAIRCYWEAARRIPESKRACAPLVRLLAAAGETDSAERLGPHLQALQHLDEVQNRVLFGSASPQPAALLPLAEAYRQAGRLWECYGWCLIAAREDPGNATIQQTLQEAKRNTDGIALRLTADDHNVALAANLSAYPAPPWGRLPDPAVASARDGNSAFSFREEAADVGLGFRYLNGTEGPPTRRMYELTGGGVAALDYDRDGYPDLYFTQGCVWPPGSGHNTPGDRLFVNRGGTAFRDVSSQASIFEQDFGQGVAVADYDADGFPDLYVANIGLNRLWRNNGDGTFTDMTEESGLATAQAITAAAPDWTTSCAIADLNGDGLPDIYDVNYVTDSDVFDRVCTRADGAPAMCMPFYFDSQPDRLWLNLGDGRFSDSTGDVIAGAPAGKGLGLAVWDAHGHGRLSLLVANDTTPNFFFEAAPRNGGAFQLEDHSLLSGLALNADGKATGCMGVAVGDVDDDGGIDLLITNFLAEPNSLYMHLADGVYSDQSRERGLHDPSVGVLGFGTQFLDADLDGRLELFVANGHIDDLRSTGRPYRMPAQFFQWDRDHFTQVDNSTLGEYFQQAWLGRTATRLDWNRDGRDDLVVGHLQDESALLTNTTPPIGNWLALRLVGTRSERDAIGTMVTIRIGGRTVGRQLTAGDGYQASNQRLLVFGIGSNERIDAMEVRWPSGTVQRFSGLSLTGETVLVEGRTLLILPR